jgi:hypothetical protein
MGSDGSLAGVSGVAIGVVGASVNKHSESVGELVVALGSRTDSSDVAMAVALGHLGLVLLAVGAVVVLAGLVVIALAGRHKQRRCAMDPRRCSTPCLTAALLDQEKIVGIQTGHADLNESWQVVEYPGGPAGLPDHRKLRILYEWCVARRPATAAIQANRVMIAIRNVALPHGNSRKTTKNALAATEMTAIGRQPGSPRTASAMASGVSTPVAMIKRNAIPCTQPCQLAGLPPLSIGTSTQNPAKISATPTWRAAPPRNCSPACGAADRAPQQRGSQSASP